MPVLPEGKVPPKTIPEFVSVPVPLASFLASGKFVPLAQASADVAEVTLNLNSVSL